jgi:hypothetical protein
MSFESHTLLLLILISLAKSSILPLAGGGTEDQLLGEQRLTIAVSDLRAYKQVTLDSLDLNRIATRVPVNSANLLKFPNFDMGFTWNDEDSASTKWRPQGITGLITSTSKEFIAVSWYGREEEAYNNRGARIAFVDCTDLKGTSDLKYRHVLLVDENYNTFPDLHAGGLVSTGDGLVHVPDSRSGYGKKVYTFSINNILYIPDDGSRDEFYTYAYIMPRMGSYSVPITPSFMSFDWEKYKVLLGTFYQCSSYHQDTSSCLANTNNRLSWYTIGSVNSSSPWCAPFFSEMQGAASSSASGTAVLWTSSSYGSSHGSHLHITNLGSSFVCSGTSTVVPGFREISYPPGLEDIHMADPKSKFQSHLWMHTEFGTNDGSGNMRTVFSTPVKYLEP